MSLRFRLALIGVAVLAATIAAVGLLAHELSRVQGRSAIDRALLQELGDASVGLPELVATQVDGDVPTPERLTAAAERYLAVNPGSDRHLMVITVGTDQISTVDGPEMLLDLYEQGRFPAAAVGQLTTDETPRGPARVLTAPLTVGGEPVGTISVAGPLAGVVDDARDTLVRIAIAGVTGLAIGAIALTLATRRALAPLSRLADAARNVDRDIPSARVPEPARNDEVGVVAHELNHMFDRIEADARRRQQLLASISHELRTPVAVVSGHLEMFEALGPADEHTATRLAAVMHAELGRLSRIIDDLSAVAQGTADIPLVVGPVFLPDLFHDLRERLAGLNVAGVEVQDPPTVVAEIDQTRVLQTLLNLVANASLHTPHGTRIWVTAEHDASTITLKVHDDGPGVRPDLLPTIFDPFVTSRPGGPGRTSGLGLSVARAYTEAQHGTLELESSARGTTAVITLPAATVDVPGDDGAGP